ncbi:hypothetical protein ACOSQ4_009815 [Xanthoceras sorbifolium]
MKMKNYLPVLEIVEEQPCERQEWKQLSDQKKDSLETLKELCVVRKNAEGSETMAVHEIDKSLHYVLVCHIIDKQCESDLDFPNKNWNSMRVSMIGNSKKVYLDHRRVAAVD